MFRQAVLCSLLQEISQLDSFWFCLYICSKESRYFVPFSLPFHSWSLKWKHESNISHGGCHRAYHRFHFFLEMDCPWITAGHDPNQWVLPAFFWDIWYNLYPVDNCVKLSAGTETIDIIIFLGYYLQTLSKNYKELDKHFSTSVFRSYGHICNNKYCPWLSPLDIGSDLSFLALPSIIMSRGL